MIFFKKIKKIEACTKIQACQPFLCEVYC